MVLVYTILDFFSFSIIDVIEDTISISIAIYYKPILY